MLLNHSGFDVPRAQPCFPFCFCPVDTGVVKDDDDDDDDGCTSDHVIVCWGW